jgi:hypothetical protein
MSTVTIFALVFGAIGVAIMLAGVNTYIKGNKARDWAIAQGKVVTSQVNRSVGGKLTFSGWVVYDYSIMGQSYRSQTVTTAELMNIQSTGKAEAYAKVAKYPVGTTVSVYYDPNDPKRSVLEIVGDSSLLMLGGIFVIFALVFYYIQ